MLVAMALLLVAGFAAGCAKKGEATKEGVDARVPPVAGPGSKMPEGTKSGETPAPKAK